MLQLVDSDADDRVQLLQAAVDERDRELKRAHIDAANATSSGRECDAALQELQAKYDAAQGKLESSESRLASLQRLCSKLQVELKQHDAALPRIAQLQLRLAQAEENTLTSSSLGARIETASAEVGSDSEGVVNQGEVARLRAQMADLGKQLVALRREYAELAVGFSVSF
jgi:chromosome segregation ATPase